MWRNRQTRRIQVPVVVNTLWVQVPSSAPGKSQNLFGFWLFLYDDVELKPLQKGVPKNPKRIFGEEERQRSGFGVLF